ncbi:hypothetical protein BDZ89DRAFT_1159855 [Hymenopellis radicata]|nr:hypothetical protein BDZ89DRAFT_1159855 [Hymenopellis radicata]
MNAIWSQRAKKSCHCPLLTTAISSFVSTWALSTMNTSTLSFPSQRAPTHYNPPDVYDSDSSDSDTSSDEESDDEALEKDEEAVGADAESADGEEGSVEGDDDDSISSLNYLRYQVHDDQHELAPTEDGEEDSLGPAGEGLNSEDFDDTVEENEDDMEDDFLLTALEEEGNKNECPHEERDLEATLPSKVEKLNDITPPNECPHEELELDATLPSKVEKLNDIPPPLSYAEDQINTIQPSLPAPDLLPIPNPRSPRKSKGKKKVEIAETSSVNETQDAEWALREWNRKKAQVHSMRYDTPFMLANPRRPGPITDGKPLPSRQKRERALSENKQSQPSEVDRTPKRARLDQAGKASPSAEALNRDSSNLTGLVGGSAPVESSFRQLWDEAEKSNDYTRVEVPKFASKANYHDRLLSAHPHLKEDPQHAYAFFAKEYIMEDNKAITCPLPGCGAASTVGRLYEHVRCHKNGEGKFVCTVSHDKSQLFTTDKAMAKHIAKDHLGKHYLCPHCDTKLTPVMNKFVLHLQVCRVLKS